MGYLLLYLSLSPGRLAFIVAYMGYPLPPPGHVDGSRYRTGHKLNDNDPPRCSDPKVIRESEKTKLSRIEWTLLLTGTVITIIGYTMDYMSYMLSSFHFIKLITFQDYGETLEYSSSYIPTLFPWLIFLTGEILFLTAISLYYYRRTASIRNS